MKGQKMSTEKFLEALDKKINIYTNENKPYILFLNSFIFNDQIVQFLIQKNQFKYFINI